MNSLINAPEQRGHTDLPSAAFDDLAPHEYRTDIPWELLPRLEVTCCECRCRFQIGPSRMMTIFGINSGFACCPRCDKSLRFEATGPDSARSELLDDYLARTAAEQSP